MTDENRVPDVWRVKTAERIRPSTKQERADWLRDVGYNLFSLKSTQVFIDLLTDSGTGAMSAYQWAALMKGDETYAGSQSFDRLRTTIQELFGFEYVLPVHQGRAAENSLFSVLVTEGHIIPANSHFDTTRAHIESRKAVALCCPLLEAFQIGCRQPFKGNVNLEKLQHVLEESHEQIPFVLVTVTCNSTGGQPVSLQNLRDVKKLADQYRKPLILDSARFAENAWFIQQREPGYASKSIRDIVHEIYELADAMLMSGKKDGLVNIGGFLATRRQSWYKEALSFVILYEGFETYGGLAGRDMEALAVGLNEVIDRDYLTGRIGQVQRFGQMLLDAQIPVQQPIGGHAVVIDATAFLPLVPKEEFVAQTLAVELFVEAGVRGVEIGTLLNGRDPETGRNRYADTEFLRLAIPRRVYSDSHLNYVAKAIIKLYKRRLTIKTGFVIREEAKILRHFTVRLERKSPKGDNNSKI